MENTRETKELIVGAHKLVVKTYLTGRELRIIQNEMMDNLEMKQKSGETEITGFKGALLRAQEDKQITTTVLSFDGSTEGILDKVLDLPAFEYQEVVAYIKEITEKKEVASS